MNILITGGSGFIGEAVSRALVADGHHVGVVSRHPAKASRRLPTTVDVRQTLPLFNGFEPEVVINLAGEPIANRRWSKARKNKLMESRVQTTEQLVEWLKLQGQRPKVFISASAVGFYGHHSSEKVSEQTPKGNGFSSDLCAAWEAAALKAKSFCDAVSIIRIGLVLDQPGGLLDRFVPPFKLGLGGRFGSGEQYMPWVHRRDVVRIIQFLIDSPEHQGVFNVSAPNPVTNATFASTLAKQLNRPQCLHVPAVVLNTAFGEMTELMLEGANMVPQRLLDAGFEFEFPVLSEALAEIFER